MLRGTAIVTGSSRGIGAAIARRLSGDGYRVCVNDIAAQRPYIDSVVSELNKAHGEGTAIGVVSDVTKLSEVRSMIDQSVKELGPLTIMVANAGICQIKEALSITENDMRRMFDVNLLGLFNSYTAAARQMISQGPVAPSSPGYKIIGAASIVAFKPYPLACHYTASKYAVRGFTEAFAQEMAKYHINVNAYAPAFVGTAMYDQIGKELAEIGVKNQTEDQNSVDKTGQKRLYVPDDIAKLVGGVLAGPDAEFLTGQTVVLDGAEY